jgi:hypothetical protein
MMATMGLIMAGFLTFLVVALCLSMVFIIVDMLFSHRISDTLRVWYERKFRT